ncbi:hypothetical protein [Xanthomonas fragariae]|uniref:hypothetical protein n=1 Tax=Xanthomonas fragariae TaxID=48664 RepID=UPI0022AA5187|nr:hypothetical protein [Xanthomonas fragariae]WAT15335.1 hypothetical protein OZ429_02185 [Xanthomonas fragariae]
MSNDKNGNQGIDDLRPPNGVKAPGKNEDLLQDGPAQISQIDDDDGIEDDVDEEDDEEDEEDDQASLQERLRNL